ncbi:hypothetical protein FO519_003236 [Halicephalobus sp. NKZ332]|nr:hypothetical protein FO519_003236 [Halicephalobus sp. NKZ332]
MVNVAITGGSGFIAHHVIKKLQENSSGLVDSILTIDKKPKLQKFLNYPEKIPVKHLQLDIVDTEALEQALSGIDVVFHFARKRLEFLFDAEKEVEFSELYIRDNITATESVLSAMISSNVQHLIFLSDAYANLGVEDNFGLSEDNYPGIPNNFIMGEAGETRIRAELIARSFVGKKLRNGKDLRGAFPRPVFVYGEGEKKLPLALEKVARRHDGSVPYLEGSSRGMFQFIYAGNLAGMLETTMKTLLEAPERCNGDYFYCMDDTKASKIHEFLEPLASSMDISFGPSSNYYLSLITSLFSEYRERFLGSNQDLLGGKFSTTALRFLFGFAYGFSHRKQQLTIDYRPEMSSSEAMERTAAWIKGELKNKSMKLKMKHQDNVLRMG